MSDRAFVRLWGAPLVLGVLTALGLMSALLGDGLWDAVSWVALAVPVAVCLWCGLVGRRGPRT